MKRDVAYEIKWFIRLGLAHIMKAKFVTQYFYYRYLLWVATKHKSFIDVHTYGARSLYAVFQRVGANDIIIGLLHERMEYLDKIQ